MHRQGTIEATIRLSAEQIAQILSAMPVVDRRAAMVDKHGEACTKAAAARILSCSPGKIHAMIEDGRIRTACEGSRVDVRSLCDYIETRDAADRDARRRKGRKKQV